jgi:hypothetical protein
MYDQVVAVDSVDTTNEPLQVHPIFTEMLELRRMDVEGVAWKEVARWVKFEESVDEGGNRWSKPHVSSPALYSLSQLHNCIADGVNLIDINASSWEQIVGRKEF